MRKELTAEELEREIEYIQETGANSIRYYELFDKFATARLEAYKEELIGVIKSKIMLEPKLFVEIGRHQAFKFILSHLTKKQEE